MTRSARCFGWRRKLQRVASGWCDGVAIAARSLRRGTRVAAVTKNRARRPSGGDPLADALRGKASDVACGAFGDARLGLRLMAADAGAVAAGWA